MNRSVNNKDFTEAINFQILFSMVLIEITIANGLVWACQNQTGLKLNRLKILNLNCIELNHEIIWTETIQTEPWRKI